MSQLLASNTHPLHPKKKMYGNFANTKISASDIFSSKTIDPINGIWKMFIETLCIKKNSGYIC